jgi:hypothetical protein
MLDAELYKRIGSMDRLVPLGFEMQCRQLVPHERFFFLTRTKLCTCVSRVLPNFSYSLIDSINCCMLHSMVDTLKMNDRLKLFLTGCTEPTSSRVQFATLQKPQEEKSYRQFIGTS